MATTDRYWASLLRGPDLASAILKAFKRFEDRLRRTDLPRMEAATRAYYGKDENGYDTSSIGKAGGKEQVRILKDNQYRAAVQNKLTIATADPPGFLPVPVNTDSDSQGASLLTKGMLDYYFDDKDVDAHADAAAELAEVLGWGWVDAPWNPQAGDVVEESKILALAGRQPETTGDVEVRSYLPIDVAEELGARGECPWRIIRRYRNKWDLAAEVRTAGAPPQEEQDSGDGVVVAMEEPDAAKLLAQRIETLPKAERTEVERIVRELEGNDDPDPDEVAVYELRHLPTPALPKGRCVSVVGDGIFLHDYAHQYEPDDFGLYRIDAAKRFGTPRAYTSSHDALGLQRAVDTLTSIPYSNQAALGLNVIWSPLNSGFTSSKVREGLVHIQTSGQVEPKVLQLGQTSADTYAFRDTLKRDIAAHMGQDALSMGREERQLSGAAMALLDTRTQRAVSKLAKAHTKLRQDIANGILRRVKKFGTHTRKVAMLVGKMKRPMLQEFSGKDLAGIDRVKSEVVSPLMRTPAGRLEVAMQAATIKNPDGTSGLTVEQFFEVVQFGRFEQLTEGKEAARRTIREENERLAAGEVLDVVPMVDPLTGQPAPPQPGAVATAVFTDHPLQHIAEHATVLAGAAARRTPEIVANVRAHMEAHMVFLLQWMSGDPVMLAIHGPPPQMPMPTATQPPAPGATSGTGPPQEGEQSQAPAPEQAPGGPQMPQNPSTGQRYSPTGEVAVQ